MSRYRGPSSTLYVRNVSERARYDDLRRLFAKYGRIIDVTIPVDYFTRQPKGYCFVEYEDPRDAEEAQYRLDRQRLFGRELEVEFARGDRKTPGEMRARDREGRPYRRNGGHDSRRSRSRSERRRRRSHSRSRSASKDRRSSSGNNANDNRSPSREHSRSRDRSVKSDSRRSRTRSRSGDHHKNTIDNGRSRSHSREN